MNVCTLLVHEHNDGALLAVLESKLACRHGIGEATVDQIREIHEAQQQQVPLWDVMLNWRHSGRATTRQANAVDRFVAWRHRCDSRACSLPGGINLGSRVVFAGVRRAAAASVTYIACRRISA